MKTILKNILFLTSLILMGCNEDALLPASTEVQVQESNTDAKNTTESLKTTGDVEVTFIANPGGQGGNNHQVALPSEGQIRFAHVIFNAHEAAKNNAAKGDVEITIKDENGLVKREIRADVYDVDVDPTKMQAWILAVVVEDKRHDEQHSDQSVLAVMENAGFGQMNGQNSKGNQQDGTNDEGTHADGNHTDGEHDSGCNSDDENHGNKSRVGDTMELVVYDGGTPGTNGDELRWKWYGENQPHVSATDHSELGDLCLKEIIEGNLVVHIK